MITEAHRFFTFHIYNDDQINLSVSSLIKTQTVCLCDERTHNIHIDTCIKHFFTLSIV